MAVQESGKKAVFGIPGPGKHEAAIIHEVITSSHQFIRLISKIQASAKTHIMIITPLYWQRACIILLGAHSRLFTGNRPVLKSFSALITLIVLLSRDYKLFQGL